MLITLPTLCEKDQIVSLSSLAFTALSEPTGPSTPNLHRLTVQSFTATLVPFVACGTTSISESTLVVPADALTVGIYDSNTERLHVAFGGTIENDHTPCNSLMIFSSVAEGPVGVDGQPPASSMEVTGRSLDPQEPGAVPTVSEWGLIVMTLLVLTAGTMVLRRRGAVPA